ncbi:MAG TPA: cysteine synthase family protein [Firmicutes bacterium]|nr:cysteine synthase family protein [Bacillota bacterium]
MNLTGKTPLLEIKYRFRDGAARTIFAKLETYNPTGSIKDRIAEYIISRAKETGELKEGMPIIEATSGNTGIAFAGIGRRYGHPVDIFMPNWLSTERIRIMECFGAKVHLVSAEEGGFLGSIAKADEMARAVNGFRPNQFSNEDNTKAHYLGTGKELWEQLERLGLRIDVFVAGVGTGGTVMGVGRLLREMNSKALIHPLEPSNSPTLTTGHKVGKHRIQGISDEFIPPILRLNELEEVVQVDDGDAIIMAQKLAIDIGLGVGISSGANFLGAVLLQNKYGSDAVVTTVFADDNKKYLSTDYIKEEPIKDGFLSPDIELLSYKLHRY